MVFSDRTTAFAYINKIETSHSDIYQCLTKLIWEWAEKKDIHITAAHIPGVKNIEAVRNPLSYQLNSNGCYLLIANRKPWCC